MSQPAAEHDLQKDWIQLARTAGVVFRYPRTIAAVTIVFAIISWTFTMTRDPMYRATGSVKLEDPLESNPALKAYNIPTGVVEIEEAFAIVRSYSLMEQIVDPPSDGALATPDHPEWDRHLGLTTLVDDETNRPLRGMLAGLSGPRSPEFRVFAFVDEAEDGAPYQLRLRFLSKEQVVVSRVSSGLGIEWARDKPTLLEFEEGKPLTAHGLTFRVAVRGDVDNRTFIMRRLSHDAAVRTFRTRLRTNPVSDQQGIFQVGIEDLDPARAAAVANALAASYVRFDRRQVLDKAEGNVRLIETNLTKVRDDLEVLEQRITKILSEYPDAIDPEASSGSLFSRKSAGETQVTRLANLARQLRAMVGALEDGDFPEVSRIGPSLDDQYIAKMLEDVVYFERELAEVDREGKGDYKKSLMLIRDGKLDALEEAKGRFNAMDDIVTKLEAGNTDVLARLGNELAKDGSIAVDWITRQHLTEFAQMQIQLMKLLDEYQEEYEIVVEHKVNMAKQQQVILDLVTAQREGLKARAEEYQRLADNWESIAAEHPAGERVLIEKGLAELWTRIEAGVRSRLRGVEGELALIQDDLDVVTRRLSSLPYATQLIAEPSRQRDSLKVKADELSRDMVQVTFARDGVLDAARVLDVATPPSGRAKPVPSFGLLVGLVAGFIISLILCLAHDHLRGRPRSQPELEEATGLAVCAVVPPAPRAARDATWLALRDEPSGPVAEAYRTLRSRLRGLESMDRPMRTFAVTSTLANEGASAVNTGLATAFALEGSRVLLVDANLRTPRVAETFHLAPLPGLAECLDGRRHWMQCVQESPFDGLDVLVAGEPYYSPGDLLGSLEMRRLLEGVREEYDVVVFNLPHVTDLPDVACLAPFLDATLLVQNVDNGPPTAKVQATVRDLIRSNAKMAGTVQMFEPRRISLKLRKSA